MAIARILESLRMRRIVRKKIRVEIKALVAERLGPTAKSSPHEIEIGSSSPGHGIRISEAVEGE